MIDLIIPVYNNYQGLLRTLMSVNLDVFEITVVDDCSTDPIDTTFPIHYIRLEQNGGPGNARQVGIDNTHNDYLAFIDAGDVFLSKELQNNMLTDVKDNPDINFFIWSYIIGDKRMTEYDNRMHGKIYKRAFLDKYHITFCKESSYANEDIGFNRACRICNRAEGTDYYYCETPVIHYIDDENSITAKNNHEFLYKTQNRGLSLNIIHTVNICKMNGIDPAEEIHLITASLYYWFLNTAVERPEFLQDAWSGTKIFYDYFKDEIHTNQLVGDNGCIKKCVALRNKIHFPINIIRFIDDVQKNEIIPDKYLT